MKLLSALFIFLSLTAVAQNSSRIKLLDTPIRNIDSLRRVAASLKQQPRAYLKALVNIECSSEYYGDSLFGSRFDEIKQVSDQLSNPYGKALYWYLKGLKAHNEEYFEDSYRYYVQARQQFISNRDTVGVIMSHLEMGRLNVTGFGLTIGNPKEVLYHYNQAHDLSQRINDKEMLSLSLGLLSIYYYIQENSDYQKMEAIQRKRLAIINSLTTLPHPQRCAIYSKLSAIYFDQGNFEKAYVLLTKNYADAERLLDVVSLHAYLNNIAIACTYTKHYEEAERYLKKALTIAGSRKSTLRLGIYQNLRNLHKLKGDFKMALAYADTTTILREDIYNLQRAKELNTIQTRYQTVQKELENTTLRKQNELTEAKNIQFKVFLIMLGGVALLILFLLLKLRNSNHRLNEALSKEQVLNHTKDKIFSLLSHDLRRPLAELTDLFAVWHTPQMNAVARENLLSQIGLELLNVQFVLNNLLRWSFAQLKNLPPNRKDTSLQILCKDAIAEVKTYSDHKNIRIIERVSPFTFSVDENQFLIILRNLLNNALKFTPEGGVISVLSEQKNDTLYLRVRDTGLGMTKEKMEKIFSYPTPQKGTAGEIGLGIGLTLCKELAELNGGKIEIKSKVEVGTEIILIFEEISQNNMLHQSEALEWDSF